MFGRARHDPAAATPPSPASGAECRSGSAERQSLGDAAEHLWSHAPSHDEARAWIVEHPLLTVGGGMAAGYLAISLLSKRRPKGTRAAQPRARRPAPPHVLGDPRAFDRPSSALWLIPVVELARIGLQAATYYMAAQRRPLAADEAPRRG